LAFHASLEWKETADDPDARVLIVNSDRAQARLIARSLSIASISLTAVQHHSATEAFNDLLAQSIAGRGCLPDLIILDLDMPDFSAQRFLAQLRRADRFKRIPVVALTGQGGCDIIRRAYDFGANAVLAKQTSDDGAVEMAQTIVDFWFRIANRYMID